jgi:hypothetical protein
MPTFIGTNSANNFNLSGTLQQYNATLTNAYSGYTVSINQQMFVNDSSYDGLGGSDTLTMTNQGDVFILDDGFGNPLLRNIEFIDAGLGGDIINLSSSTIVMTTNINISGAGGNDIIWANSGNVR